MRVTIEIHTPDLTAEAARQFIEAIGIAAEMAMQDAIINGFTTAEMSELEVTIHDSNTGQPIEHER